MDVFPSDSSPDGAYTCKIARFVCEEDVLAEFVKMYHGGSMVHLLAEATAVKREFSIAIEEIFDQLSKGAIRDATKREQIFMVTAMTLAMVGIVLERKGGA